MSNGEQSVPLDVLQARHEVEQQNISNDDAVHLAGLFKTVGNELFSIDHKYVGGNSNTKALQLDQQKVFNKPIAATVTNQAQVAPPAQIPQHPDEIHPQKVNVQPAPVVNAPVIVNNNEFELRLSNLEKKFEKIIKPPYKKFNVKFKSSCLSGEFQEFDELVDALRKSLNKSSKRITITLNEN